MADVPAFDDIPSFDDLPDAAGAPAASAPPRFDDIPDFDALPDSPSGQRPAPEGALMSGVREAAHAVIPALAGTVAAGAGGALGAAGGTFVAPGPGTVAGAIGGGVAGFVGGSMAADSLQEHALKALGFDDSEQRAANAEANPKSSFVGGLAPAIATMNPVATGERLAQRVIQRGAGAAMMGGFEAGGEYVQGQDIDPTKIAIAAATGAVFPSVNRVGEKLMGYGGRMVPGRPGRESNPAADQAHVDVDDPTVETAVGDSALAESPPAPDGVTTGNPQSAPERSERNYGKGKDAAPPEGDMLTQGVADPATIAALKGEQPEAAAPAPAPAAPEAPIPGFDDHPSGVGQEAPAPQPVRSPEGLAEVSRLQREALEGSQQKAAAQQLDQEPGPAQLDVDRAAVPQVPPKAAAAIAKSKRPKLTMPEASVEAGFPKPGEPVAVGENEATKMPALKGEAPINDSVSEAQKAAGNYPKARTHDFGKPQAIETHAGDTRRGKSPSGEDWEVKLPYDYGYFNKTKGADKDHIDFARPPEGSPDLGDKHFVIDQKNADTDKFDEHKLFTYYKDEASARAAYEAGFSDGKGPERLGAITEVSRPEMVKFLAKHTSRAANKPYGDIGEAAKPAAKPAKERAVVQDLVQKLKAKGQDDAAAKLLQQPDEQILKAIEGKRTRKYGVGTGASAGYAVEGLKNSEGAPVTANTKAKALARSNQLAAIREWFDVSKGRAAKGEETDGQLLDRVRQGADTARSNHVVDGKPTDPTEGWQPTHKPAEWLWAREAKRLLAKPTPGAVKKFRDAERMLHGSAEDVDNYRGGNRIEADIARSKRSGDEAVASAENKLSTPGVNAEEDAMIERLDAKRKPGFDVPHEEAEAMVEPTPVKTRADLKELPRKTVDVKDSELAKIDTKKVSAEVMSAADKRKAEAASLAGKKSKASTAESEGAAGTGKQIKVIDEAEKQRIMDALNAATKKAASRDPSLDITAPEEKAPKRGNLLTDFAADTSGKVDIAKIRADLEAAFKKTDHTSYIAKKSNGANDDYFRSLGEDLHRVNQEDRNHWIGILHQAGDMPKEINNPKTLEQIYHARDADSAHVDLPGKQAGKTNIESLPPDVKALYDKHLKPLLEENDKFVANIRGIDPNRMGADVLNHISRITKGDSSEYNMLKGKDDPTSPLYNGMSVSANAAKDRKFMALERVSDGRRFVISPRDNGMTLWNKYKRTNIKDPDFAFEDGAAYKAGPVDYVMRQATTKEIEANARGGDGKGKPMVYYKNAGLSAAVANAQLGSMARHLAELARISETPEFKKFSTRNPLKGSERGWQESNLPNFKGTYMHPDMKAVFDDYAGHPETPYSQFNSAITKLLFWMPTAHIANVGAHWYVGRGWDNITPKGVKSFVMDTPRAIKSVINQDAYQMEMRRNGAGTIYGSVLTRDMMPKIGKAFQEDIIKNPSTWGPIADKLGVPLKSLGSAVYNASSKVMWAANDVFLTQRVMELEKKGYTMKQAIIDAERDIPNYRIPIKVIGSGAKGRQFAQAMGDPRITSFGRYHYGMMNSYANIAKDALGSHATAGDRLEAVGKIMAMGMLGLVVFPLMDQLQKKITGNEGASQQRRGPLSIPSHLAEAARGKEDVMSAVRATATVPPLYQTILETLSNKDFRGKPVVEPGDVAAATGGSAVAAGRAAVQFGGHLARGLVSPVNTLSNALKKDVGPLGAVRDQATDAKNPSAKAVKYEKQIDIHNRRDTLTRFKHGGSDPLEAAYNKFFGYR